MKVIFTCGGTGGHINPAIAVAKILKERRPECEILFVGADDGMETRLVPREGFRLETLTISNYLRSLKPSAIWHNIQTVSTIRKALKRAEQIIRDFQPDVIVGTGGYASFPMLKMGTKLGIPTAYLFMCKRSVIIIVNSNSLLVKCLFNDVKSLKTACAVGCYASACKSCGAVTGFKWNFPNTRFLIMLSCACSLAKVLNNLTK